MQAGSREGWREDVTLDLNVNVAGSRVFSCRPCVVDDRSVVRFGELAIEVELGGRLHSNTQEDSTREHTHLVRGVHAVRTDNSIKSRFPIRLQRVLFPRDHCSVAVRHCRSIATFRCRSSPYFLPASPFALLLTVRSLCVSVCVCECCLDRSMMNETVPSQSASPSAPSRGTMGHQHHHHQHDTTQPHTPGVRTRNNIRRPW